eukprot:1547277-Amphidinium_carterae.2
MVRAQIALTEVSALQSFCVAVLGGLFSPGEIALSLNAFVEASVQRKPVHLMKLAAKRVKTDIGLCSLKDSQHEETVCLLSLGQEPFTPEVVRHRVQNLPQAYAA